MRPATILLALAFAVSLAAQQQKPPSTAPVSGHDKGRDEHRDKTAKNDAVPTGAVAKEQAGARNERVWNDATRIAGLLRDVQTQNVNVSASMWRTIANEANTLANRLYGRSAGNRDARAAAASLRTHVREMRAAALKGDAAAARRHASAALPFAYRLIDWSA